MSKNKDGDELLRAQIDALIRDEIQEGINDYIDQKETQEKKEEETGLGFAQRTVARQGEEKLEVNIPQSEIDKPVSYTHLTLPTNREV